MGRMRRFVTMALLSLALSMPLYANMPVIDISAIASGISQFATTVEQYSRQIQQWKSEYDRMVQAAKSIAEGNYWEGISSFANQLASWDSTDAYLDAFLYNLGDTADLIDNLETMGENFAQNFKDAWAWKDQLTDPESFFDVLDNISDIAGGVSSGVARTASMVSSYAGTISDLGVRTQALLTQLEGGLVTEDSIAKLEEELAAAREDHAKKQEEYQQSLSSVSSSTDVEVAERQQALDAAAAKVQDLQARLEEMRESREKILTAYEDAERARGERLDEMAASFASNQAKEEVKEAASNYASAHKPGGLSAN